MWHVSRVTASSSTFLNRRSMETPSNLVHSIQFGLDFVLFGFHWDGKMIAKMMINHSIIDNFRTTITKWRVIETKMIWCPNEIVSQMGIIS